MNILITRPLIDTEDLMGKLFSLGHKIVHIPTLKILSVNVSPVDSKKYDAFKIYKIPKSYQSIYYLVMTKTLI